MNDPLKTAPPYPPSFVITGLVWDDEIVRLGGEWTGDNWPLAWGDDGLLYTSYADGNGFDEGPIYYTLAFATVSGVPPAHSAQEFRTESDVPVGWGKEGIKASGMLMAGGVLYLWVRNDIVDGDWRHARLAQSTDRGHTWTWADWQFGGTFGCPEFVQYGPNYAGARDGYVYVVSQSGNSAYDFDPGVVMARVPVGQVMQREAYQFFAGLSASGEPIWSLDLGYVGSRSHKLLSSWSYNRARVVPGIEQITDTIQERRPDPRWGEERRVLNGSRGFFDAARVNLAVRAWEGLSVEGSYWFSKAIDFGTDYTNTAAGRDAFEFQSRTQDAYHAEMKGLSNFDQPHSFLLRATYEIPRVDGAPSWVRSILSSWMVGAVALLKSGTPFSVVAGSDGPGSGNVDGTFGDRPHLMDPSVLGRTIGHPDTSTKLLPTEAFAFMAPGELRGSLGRSTFRKGSISNVNAMLSRTFPISGERQIEFRAESVNLLNTPQFASPGFSLTSDDFGFITNTLNDGRAFRLQLDVRF